MSKPSFRDVELISTLLDGKLTQADAARLQLRIAADPELAAIYQQLAQSRALLRKLPARRAPHNFTLTPKMAGIKAPTPRAFPVFRFASVVASLLLVLTFAANGLGSLAANAPAAAPAYGIGGGPAEAPVVQAPAEEARPQSGGGGQPEMPAPAATEAPLAAAPMPEATQAPAEAAPTTAQDVAAAPTATAEAMRLAAAPTAQPEATVLAEAPSAKAGGETANQQPVTETAARNAWAIPGWLQIGLFMLAVLAGGAAWFVNWRANARFARKSGK